jgi:hypothetical protein
MPCSLDRRMLLQAVLSLPILCSACTTATTAPVRPDGATPALAPGDDVTIVTKDGRKLGFEVQHVDAVAVEGGGERVPLADIAHAEVSRVDGEKTAAAVVGTAMATAFAAPVVLTALVFVVFVL